MNLEFIKPLLEGGLISKEVGASLNEAWESKLAEAREQVRAELHEEFAQRHEHDKRAVVEALNKMVSESLTAEIAEFKADRKAMNEDRVKAKVSLRETAEKFNNFLVTKLAEEIKELRSERKTQMESQQKLEKFIVHALSREIKEFAQDKRAVVEARVKLVAEGKKRIEALEKKFVAESAARLNKSVTAHLKGEITQLKEDIKVAKENNFGRKLFEAYMSEFSASYLSENAATRKMADKLQSVEKQLQESKATAAKAQALVESKEREVRIIKESNLREKTMAELLGPLNEEKAKVMKDLLESVQTPRLKAAFDKYLPAVLNGAPEKKVKIISESKVETGDKTAVKRQVEVEERDNVIEIKRLAGLN